MAWPGWRPMDPREVDQVANAPDSRVDLTPVSQAPAAAVRAAWAPLVPRQAVPMLGERLGPEWATERVEGEPWRY